MLLTHATDTDQCATDAADAVCWWWHTYDINPVLLPLAGQRVLPLAIYGELTDPLPCRMWVNRGKLLQCIVKRNCRLEDKEIPKQEQEEQCYGYYK